MRYDRGTGGIDPPRLFASLISMKIERFDEDLSHRELSPYRPVYRDLFLRIQADVQAAIPNVELIHIGSTAVADLCGKPMLDIAAVTSEPDLRKAQGKFEALGFHRRDVWVDRDDKPYVCGSVRHDDARYNINIHICHRGDAVHAESLAFIGILNRRPDLRRRYEKAKERAHAIDPADPETYNREKEAVILEIHRELRGP
jgi:GrpB-like predicted nucleotidyltransferase (UPF0157 family)